jgi:hypothetical protein
MREMRTAYKVEVLNLNLNGRDLCMAGSIIFKCILRKEDRRMLTQLMWGLLVGCEHSDDCSCKNRNINTILTSLHTL